MRQILRAGLGEDLEPVAARPAHGGGAFRRRDVEDHDRLVEERRHRDEAVEGLGLGEARMAHGMEFRRRVAALDEALPHPGDHAVVLGMDADERPVLARRDEHVEQRLVVDLEAVVGHEHLDRGVPGADQRRQMLPDGRLGRVGDDHVEGIVDDRALAGEAGIVLDDLRQVHADVLGRERDHRRGAAMRGRDRRALPGIGVQHPGGRELLDVAMRVDAARQHELAARIDLATARRRGRGRPRRCSRRRSRGRPRRYRSRSQACRRG